MASFGTRGLLVPLCCITVAGISGCGEESLTGEPTPAADQLRSDGLEPPPNPFLASSPWSAVHRNPYRQGSVPFAASESGDVLAEQLALPGLVGGWTHFSEPYWTGKRVIWSTAIPATILKIDPETFTIIDSRVPATATVGIGAAYYELNRENELIIANGRFVEAYGDRIPGARLSAIALRQRYRVPDHFFCRDEQLAALGHGYDGQLIILSELGQLGVLPADPATWQLATFTGINGADCGDPSVADEALESVDNGFAIDEAGGIFAVSSDAMYGFGWDGSQLSQRWRVAYADDGAPGAIEAGAGSGSTPTLMGTADDEDRLVVITDAQQLKHLVVYFRDDVPEDWPGLGEGRDRRIVCELPVDFGDPALAATATEQSVTVAGYSAIVVNNRLSEVAEALLEPLPPLAKLIAAALLGGDPAFAPRGIERIDYDPATRSCTTVWARGDLSFPNGVPLIARGSAQVLGNSVELEGDDAGTFGMRALDFDTGASQWFAPTAKQDCGPGVVVAALAQLPGLSALATLHGLLPDNACGNGFFSAQQMDADGTLYQGTFLGLSRWRPPASEATL